MTELVSDGPFDFVLGSDIIYHPHCLQKVPRGPAGLDDRLHVSLNQEAHS